MSYVPDNGSVVAFQGTIPWSVIGSTTNVGSVITVNQGSIATVIVGGSIAASFVPPANQSVSGTVQTDVRGSVATVIIGGSIAASFTPPANQSVSGEVSVSNFPAIQTVRSSLAGGIFPISGSVAAFVTGGISSVALAGANTVSVVGQVGASIIGLPPVNVTNFPTTQNVSGSVVASQGTVPWVVTSSIAGGIFPISGSVAAVITNTNLNVSGSVVAFQGGTPWANTNVGSVITVGQGSIAVNIIAGSIAVATGNSSVQVLNFPANQSVSGTLGASIIGTVPVVQSGTNITSVVNTVPSSMIVGASIFGALPPVTIAGGVSSVALVGANTVSVVGSVTAYQGAVPWAISGSVAAFQAGTIITSITGIPSISGTVIATQGAQAAISSRWPILITNGAQSADVSSSSMLSVKVDAMTSIVGTYVEDAAHTTGDRGLLVFGVRNDTMASITSADGDYSPIVSGPVGETITANSPITKWVQGTASMLGGTPVNGGSVLVIAAQGSSIFTYITGLQIANVGPNTVYLRLDGATSSTIGFTVAPAGGGSNIVFPNALKTNANGAFTASISGIASVYISAQGFISKV